MSERPPALDVRSVLDAAFAARDTDPAYFGEWLRDVYVEELKREHEAQDPEHFRHYASSLGQCKRRHVLERSGAVKEPFTVESLTTFEVGKHIHVLMQFGMAVHPTYELLGHEIGGRAERDGIVLSARGDVLYRDVGGIEVLYEIKSEKSYAKKYRQAEAIRDGRENAAKWEHELQLRATAAVVHRTTEFRPLWGAVLYWCKDDGGIDVQWVRLGVADVIAELEERELAWSTYQLGGTLPVRLDSFPNGGLCKPRAKDDARGMYCPVRSHCLAAGA